MNSKKGKGSKKKAAALPIVGQKILLDVAKLKDEKVAAQQSNKVMTAQIAQAMDAKLKQELKEREEQEQRKLKAIEIAKEKERNTKIAAMAVDTVMKIRPTVVKEVVREATMNAAEEFIKVMEANALAKE